MTRAGRALLGIEREIFGADAVVGAVGLDALEGSVEQLLQLFVFLAQPDGNALAVEGGVHCGLAGEAAASALARLQEARQGELVAEDEIDALGQKIELGLIELGVGAEVGLRVAGLEEGRVLAALDGADRLA